MVTWASHVDLKTGRPVEVPGARYYQNENPEHSVRVAPSAVGARNWQPMSYSPKTRLVYIPVANMPADWAPGGFFGARTSIMGYGPEEELPLGVGRLLAWDPVKREKRWAVDYPIPYNSGVLSTAGNLVFQGTATGEFRAYRADIGQLLWSSGKTGTSIQAAPVSYRLGTEQYVLVAAGRGAGLGLSASIRTHSMDAMGPARLFAFKLGGRAAMPASDGKQTPVPRPPARTASAEQVQHGELLFQDYGCDMCHGAHAIGAFERKLDGAVPDLRYAPAEVHAEWRGILLGGSRKLRGMPSFAKDMSIEDAEAIHAYVIEQA